MPPQLRDRQEHDHHANLVAHVLAAAAAAGNKPFLIEGDEGRLSFAELDRRTAAMAGRLAVLEGKAGDRIVVQVEKSPEAVLLYLGALRLGLVFVPLNTTYAA